MLVYVKVFISSSVSFYLCAVDVCSSIEKSEADIEREHSLIDQWVCLTEERNAVLVPTAGSRIPGAPADWYNITIIDVFWQRQFTAV